MQPTVRLRAAQPDAGHYPRLRAHEGHLTPDNVRLAHLLCNNRDYGWRMKINAMLGKRMSLEEIAARLNAKKVPPIHGTNRWTAASVSKGVRFLGGVLEAETAVTSSTTAKRRGRHVPRARSRI